MKKLIALTLALILALSLAACDTTVVQRGATTAAVTTAAMENPSKS